MIRAPHFWYNQKTPSDLAAKIALMPLSWIHGWLVRKKTEMYFPVPMIKPVVCVGNLVAGGAGKTHVAMALASVLQDKGYNPHLLTRGYGGKEMGPLQVSPGRDTAYDVGDEALLLVDRAPTWVSANRALGAQAAMDSGANIVVMDDGFQNSVIYKDFSFVVVDGIVGFGNKQVMPAGPLRESLKHGLSRADAVVIIGEDKTGAVECIRRFTQVPILFASLVPDEQNPALRGKKVFAFAGIGRPEKFRETLEEAGVIVAGWYSFPDHYPYDEEDMKELAAKADALGVPLITTPKDHVRLPLSWGDKVQKFSVHLVWQNPSEVVPLIEQALQKRMT